MVLDGRPLARGTNPTGLPPYDVVAEEAVLAALLMDADECVEEGVFAVLTAEDFFREQNGWAFDACRNLHQRGEEITDVTVARELERAGRTWTPDLGWRGWLISMLADHFTSVGVIAHARIVSTDSYYRRLIAAAGQIAQIAYEGGPDVHRVIQTSLDLIGGLRPPFEPRIVPAAHRFRGGVSLDFEEIQC